MDIGREVAREHPEYLKRTSGGQAAASDEVVGRSADTFLNDHAAVQKPFNGPRVDGKAQESRLRKKIEPDYPPLAQAARVQGTVRLDAVIGKDGRVQSLNVLHGDQLLINAAKQAVLDWEYEPYLVKGTPVAVMTEIDVDFRLDAKN